MSTFYFKGVAQSMVKRLRVDVSDYAHQENERMIPRLNGMIFEQDNEDIAEMVANGKANDQKVKSLEEMLQRYVSYDFLLD